jgi:hypothetical protein
MIRLQKKLTKGKFTGKNRLKEDMKFRIYNRNITTKMKMRSGIEYIFHLKYAAKLLAIRE